MRNPYDHLRHGTDDQTMWHDVFTRDEYGVAKAGIDGMVVLDVGAGVGAFAAKCLAHGAQQVVSVEPNRETCGVYRKIMEQELAAGTAVLMEGAAWRRGGEGTLRLLAGGFRSGDTMVFNTAGEDVGVKLLDFAAMVQAFQPLVIKIDAEGSEYELLRPDRPLAIPPTVKLLWIEFHEPMRQPWEGKAAEALATLKACGWSCRPIKEAGTLSKLYEFRR